MPRRVKDFIDISEYTSLDDLIRYLETIRDNLPAEHQAELKIRGDDVFGRRLTISYFREQTPEEIELESKYAGERGRGREHRAASAQARRSPVQARQGRRAAKLPLGPSSSPVRCDEPLALPQLVLLPRPVRALASAGVVVVVGLDPVAAAILARCRRAGTDDKSARDSPTSAPA